MRTDMYKNYHLLFDENDDLKIIRSKKSCSDIILIIKNKSSAYLTQDSLPKTLPNNPILRRRYVKFILFCNNLYTVRQIFLIKRVVNSHDI